MSPYVRAPCAPTATSTLSAHRRGVRFLFAALSASVRRPCRMGPLMHPFAVTAAGGSQSQPLPWLPAPSEPSGRSFEFMRLAVTFVAKHRVVVSRAVRLACDFGMLLKDNRSGPDILKMSGSSLIPASRTL